MPDLPKYTDILEALLLASDRPLPASRIAGVMPHTKADQVPALVDALNADYEAPGRAFRIRNVAGGFRLFTQPEYQSYVEALAVTTRETRLSQAALETLAVVAYRQPVSRSDVEYVRGCDCDGVMRTLLTRRLLAIKGRSEAPGRPLLYATTDRFLEYFGLASLADLPDFSEIAAMVEQPATRGRLNLVRGAAVPQEDEEQEVADPVAVADEAVDLDPVAVADEAVELDPVAVADEAVDLDAVAEADKAVELEPHAGDVAPIPGLDVMDDEEREMAAVVIPRGDEA